MHTLALIEALGVRCLDVSGVPLRHVAAHVHAAGWSAIGFAPTSDAWLVRRGDEIAIACDRWPPNHHALHEAVHAVLGADSLVDESALMAYERAVAQELGQPDYSLWRDEFSCYGMSTRDVGADDAVFASPEWMSFVVEAVEIGVILPDGRPVFGLGPHPSLLLVDPAR